MALDTHNTLGYKSTHLSACCYWTITGAHTFQRVVTELSPEYTPFSVLLLNCHRSTHLSACCYLTVTREHTFKRVIELPTEYTPSNVLVLKCHQRTHLSTCCYWTVIREHTFQRVGTELSSECRGQGMREAGWKHECSHKSEVAIT